MSNANNVLPGSLARSRTAFALIAAALLVGGSISEASPKSRHNRHHSHHPHHAHRATSNWMDANASIGSGSGRSFSGRASFHGKESASKTAPGQRFNHNAITPAHRPLP